ncbi:hypothetical protein [Sulfurimonas paralvinellae]|uniref:Uncharacterized protein n=1 Tax=Sulfurimonas paralvinellae TaxID=317658 RepID=A0A7M1B8F5_9BACT|nr:hypothetical protein [Sulfurimonas paralvinellae]QOP46000.1 hypothetical protein FM071_06705 [Sulfurimonas paralvinellae]
MEPSNETISDYDTLKGEKKKIVWAVIIVGLLIGVGFTVASKVFNAKNETIKVKEEFVTMPYGTHEMPVK